MLGKCIFEWPGVSLSEIQPQKADCLDNERVYWYMILSLDNFQQAMILYFATFPYGLFDAMT